MRYIAMLRGINLGSHNRINMPELKAACEQLGLKQVATYLQSGNIIFDSRLSRQEVAIKLRTIIKQRFGHDVLVIVKTTKEMATITNGNPYLSKNVDVTKLHATFLDNAPPAALVASLPATQGEDAWEIKGGTIYLYCPNGYGRTKLTNGLFERKLKVRATTRNWKTVTALMELATAAYRT